MGYSIDIFIKTWANDFWLLSYALKSIAKNVAGYRRIILLVPEKDKDIFDTRGMPPRTEIHYVTDFGTGYLRQQVYKMNAHKYSNADFIMFSDSDCMIHRPINLHQFVTDGKPEILYTDYNLVGDAICWKQPTSDIMGEEVHVELMRRNNLIYHRSTLENLNRWKPDLESIIMSSDSFSEFNLLGAYAMKYEREKYNFVNTAEWQYTEPKGLQCWSWANPKGDEVQRAEWAKTQKVIKEVFNEDI